MSYKSRHFHHAAGGRDFLLGAFAELMSSHLQLLGEISVAENLNPAFHAVDEPRLQELLRIYRRTVLKSFQLADIDNFAPHGKFFIAKTAFGKPSK